MAGICGMGRELELEREVNLAAGWAREIVRSAGRMEALGVDPMWVNAITLRAEGVITLLDDVREFHLPRERTKE
jgi:hypothetical protein